MKRKFHLFNCLMLRVVGAASVRWLAMITVIPPLYKVPIVLSERDILFEFMIINCSRQLDQILKRPFWSSFPRAETSHHIPQS